MSRTTYRQRWKIDERINQLLPLVILASEMPRVRDLAKVMGVSKRSIERYLSHEMSCEHALVEYAHDGRGRKRVALTADYRESRRYAVSQLESQTPLHSMLATLDYERIMAYLALVSPEQCAQIDDYIQWFEVVAAKVDVDTIQSYLSEAQVPYTLQKRWAYLIAEMA